MSIKRFMITKGNVALEDGSLTADTVTEEVIEEATGLNIDSEILSAVTELEEISETSEEFIEEITETLDAITAAENLDDKIDELTEIAQDESRDIDEVTELVESTFSTAVEMHRAAWGVDFTKEASGVSIARENLKGNPSNARRAQLLASLEDAKEKNKGFIAWLKELFKKTWEWIKEKLKSFTSKKEVIGKEIVILETKLEEESKKAKKEGRKTAVKSLDHRPTQSEEKKEGVVKIEETESTPVEKEEAKDSRLGTDVGATKRIATVFDIIDDEVLTLNAVKYAVEKFDDVSLGIYSNFDKLKAMVEGKPSNRKSPAFKPGKFLDGIAADYEEVTVGDNAYPVVIISKGKPGRTNKRVMVEGVEAAQAYVKLAKFINEGPAEIEADVTKVMSEIDKALEKGLGTEQKLDGTAVKKAITITIDSVKVMTVAYPRVGVALLELAKKTA